MATTGSDGSWTLREQTDALAFLLMAADNETLGTHYVHPQEWHVEKAAWLAVRGVRPPDPV